MYYETLPEECRGPYIESMDQMFRDEEVDNLKSKKVHKILVVNNTHQAYTLVSDLRSVGRTYTKICADGDCMYDAVLSCVCVPEGFGPLKFRK